MSRIYWDTMLFIYWLEDNPKYAKRVDAIYHRMQTRRDELLTSAFTFGEVLAGVHRKSAADRAQEVRQQLNRIVAEVVPFTVETADHYARIRGSLNLPLADAIHLASAAQSGTDLFLTHDKRLLGKFVSGIQFLASFRTFYDVCGYAILIPRPSLRHSVYGKLTDSRSGNSCEDPPTIKL